MGKYEALGLAFAVPATAAAFIFGMGYLHSSDTDVTIAQIELEKAKVEQGYVIQERDLNGDGTPEVFFEVGDKKYFLSVDGKNIENTLE
jgi:hypothetical protein